MILVWVVLVWKHRANKCQCDLGMRCRKKQCKKTTDGKRAFALFCCELVTCFELGFHVREFWAVGLCALECEFYTLCARGSDLLSKSHIFGRKQGCRQDALNAAFIIGKYMPHKRYLGNTVYSTTLGCKKTAKNAMHNDSHTHFKL